MRLNWISVALPPNWSVTWSRRNTRAVPVRFGIVNVGCAADDTLVLPAKMHGEFEAVHVTSVFPVNVVTWRHEYVKPVVPSGSVVCALFVGLAVASSVPV